MKQISVLAENDLRAGVLKVADHGSKTPSTIEFLERVKPQHVVIPVAKLSPFGYPYAEALARLQTTNARIWRSERMRRDHDFSRLLRPARRDSFCL
ncbi:MAG: hypothetical protein ACREAB_17725 [Blastocatellia bacterium]